jgi:hypothetical protein
MRVAKYLFVQQKIQAHGFLEIEHYHNRYMAEENSKVCPYCAEPIKVAAKICPWCRQWLSTYSLRNPAVFAAVFYLCMVIFTIGFLAFFQRLLKPGVDFSPYRDSVSIVESRMNLSDNDKQPMVYVVVVVTNKSELSWKDVQTDVRFFDKAGILIDTGTDWGRGVIFPHGDLAFRIRTQPSHPLSEYESYKVYIRAARDARAHF